ncbi:MAG: DUF2628 domain-containing protein [Rhodospirillales bacterium]|nr:DUF2628 domain-containing protein [Rhodospirillales bacterium]
MRIYSVHLRRHGLDPDRDIKLVKEGFSWPAFFLGALWALWHRLWGPAAVILIAYLVVGFAVHKISLDPLSRAALYLGLAAIVGYLGNDLRCRKLARLGFALGGVAQGKDSDLALHRYLVNTPDMAAGLRS